MTAILQIIFDALSLGSLYALGALGIALIFGVMRLVNFAHGDYISFCVFAMLWPSIDAAAVVFAGNLPTFILIIPQYQIIQALGIYNTYWALLLPGFSGGVWSMFLMRQFMRTLPSDLIESARVDGAGHARDRRGVFQADLTCPTS